MGVNLGPLISRRQEVDLSQLSGRILCLDAYNALYQFLAIIRQPDGTPLMNSRGEITSHLSGLFYRTVNLMERGIKVIYCFDGKPPSLKEREIAERIALREKYRQKLAESLERGDLEEIRRYAAASVRLEDYMVETAKELLTAMGIPWVQAPAEGEAQAAYLVQQGDAWATASQDYDSLLFGSPRMVRNVSITGRRKLPRKNVYIEIKPEVIELKSVLDELQLTREQLVDLAILIGTDYNPGGFRGIGPKRALQLIHRYGSLENALGHLSSREWEGLDIEAIRKAFLEPEVTTNYKLEWKPIDEEAVIKILVDKYEFSLNRVKKAIERVKKVEEEARRPTLERWFA